MYDNSCWLVIGLKPNRKNLHCLCVVTGPNLTQFSFILEYCNWKSEDLSRAVEFKFWYVTGNFYSARRLEFKIGSIGLILVPGTRTSDPSPAVVNQHDGSSTGDDY